LTDREEICGICQFREAQSVFHFSFPKDFMFQLDVDEAALLRSQSVTLKSVPHGRGDGPSK